MTSEESTRADLAALADGLVAALERRDFDQAMSYFAADPVWDMSATGMGTFAGTDAIRGLLEDWTRSYEEWECELEDLLELRGGVVLVALSERGRLAGSDGRVQLRYAAVVVRAGDAIVRVSSHRDIDEARAVAETLCAERA